MVLVPYYLVAWSSIHLFISILYSYMHLHKKMIKKTYVGILKEMALAGKDCSCGLNYRQCQESEVCKDLGQHQTDNLGYLQKKGDHLKNYEKFIVTQDSFHLSQFQKRILVYFSIFFFTNYVFSNTISNTNNINFESLK